MKNGERFQVGGKKFQVKESERKDAGGRYLHGYDIVGRGGEAKGFVWKEEGLWRASAWKYLGIGKGYENSLAITRFKTMKEAAQWVARSVG